MRIVEDTAERMVLRDRSLWTSFVFAPLGLLLAYLAPTHPPFASYVLAAVMGLVAVFWFSSTDFVLDRVSRTCDLRRLTLQGAKRWSLAFDDIHDVRLDRTETRHGPYY